MSSFSGPVSQYMMPLSLVCKLLCGLLLIPCSFGNTVLNRDDSILELNGREGVALIDNGLHSCTLTGVGVYDADDIAGGPTNSYNTQGSTIDMASIGNRIFQLTGGIVYEVNLDGNYVGDFFVSTQSGYNPDAIGSATINGTDYITFVDFGSGEYGAYELGSGNPVRHDLGVFTTLPSWADGMDSYLAVNGERLEDVVFGIAGDNLIGQYMHGERISNEVIFLNNLSGSLSDVDLSSRSGTNIFPYYVTGAGAPFGETGSTDGTFPMHVITHTTNDTSIAWLQTFGYTNNYNAIDNTNPDSDSYPTWQEYILDYNPTNAETDFMATGLYLSNTLPRITFELTSTGRTYRLYALPNLMQTGATVLITVTGTATKTTVILTNTTATSTFYHIGVTCP